jgi:hypothetical protein
MRGRICSDHWRFARWNQRDGSCSSDYRESKLSWVEVMEHLQSRGLENSPKLAIGDRALGF